MVIEIRTDGSCTIARGAIEDVVRGDRVAVKAEGTTPLAVAPSLARAILQAPFLFRSASEAPSLLRTAVAALLPRGRGRKPEGDR